MRLELRDGGSIAHAYAHAYIRVYAYVYACRRTRDWNSGSTDTPRTHVYAHVRTHVDAQVYIHVYTHVDAHVWRAAVAQARDQNVDVCATLIHGLRRARPTCTSARMCIDAHVFTHVYARLWGRRVEHVRDGRGRISRCA